MNRPSAAPAITVITNGNYFALRGLRPLLQAYGGRWRWQIVCTSGLRDPSRPRLPQAARLLRRWGPRYAAYKVATLALPRGVELLARRPRTVADWCRRRGFAVLEVADVHAPEVLAQLDAFGPDLVLSFSCPYPLRADVLRRARVGCVNVHGSLLPRDAGVCTYVHVLADGAAVTGVTVHEMVERLDAGAILAQQELPIEPGVTVFRLFRSQCDVAARLLLDTIPAVLAAGVIGGRPQDLAARTYRREPRAADIRRARSHGHGLATLADVLALITDADADAD